jgi:uncharacterized protein DUF1194
MMRIMAVLGLLALAAGEAAAESVDLELVLLADASRSIDDGEIRLQREGYTAAITHPEVLRAIEQGFEQRIAVTYVEWGDARSQDVVVPWTIIDSKDTAAAFARTLMARPRRAFGPNAIGSAPSPACHQAAASARAQARCRPARRSACGRRGVGSASGPAEPWCCRPASFRRPA